MKLNIKQIVKNYKGEPIEVKSGDKVIASTLGELLEYALANVTTGTPEERYKRGKLCAMLTKKDSDYAIEDIAIIKSAVGERFFPIAVYTIHNILDNLKAD